VSIDEGAGAAVGGILVAVDVIVAALVGNLVISGVEVDISIGVGWVVLVDVISGLGVIVGNGSFSGVDVSLIAVETGSLGSDVGVASWAAGMAFTDPAVNTMETRIKVNVMFFSFVTNLKLLCVAFENLPKQNLAAHMDNYADESKATLLKLFMGNN
jgi:hypothetical protein